MKTTYKTMTNTKIANEKRKKFQEETGLKWDYYHTGEGMRFTPVVVTETPLDDKAAACLLPYLTNKYREFTRLAYFSGLPLNQVLIGAKTLVRQNKAVGTVNRMGGFFALRLKHQYEK